MPIPSIFYLFGWKTSPATPSDGDWLDGDLDLFAAVDGHFQIDATVSGVPDIDATVSGSPELNRRR